jgi:hypothetical protein
VLLEEETMTEAILEFLRISELYLFGGYDENK